MEKKLLLACMFFGNFIFCSANDLQSKEELSIEQKERADYIALKKVLKENCFIQQQLDAYEKEKDEVFKEALDKALSGDTTAIEKLVQENEKEYTQEAQDKKNKQDDGVIGFLGGAKFATAYSLNGYVIANIDKRKEGKAAINNKLKTKFIKHQDSFNTDVMEIFKQEIAHRERYIAEIIMRGLNSCDLGDAACLCAQGVSWSDIIGSDYFDKFVFATFTPVIKAVNEKDIPLSKEAIIKICQSRILNHEGKEYSMEKLNNAKQKAQAQVHEILNTINEKSNVKHNNEKILHENESQQHDQDNHFNGEEE